MKGQSLIVQFLLFFMIGLGLFAAIGGLFRTQSDILRLDIAEANRELVASYVSSIAVSMATNCKDCNASTYSVNLKNVTANYINVLNFSGEGIQIFSEPNGGNLSMSMHHLNQTLRLNGNSSSALPIILKLNNTERKLELNLTYR